MDPQKKIELSTSESYNTHRFINSNVNPKEKKGALSEVYIKHNFMKNHDYGTCLHSIGRFNVH